MKKNDREVKYDIDEYRKKRKRKKRISLVLSVLTFVTLVIVVVGGFYLYRNYDMEDLTAFFLPEKDEGTLMKSSFPIPVSGSSPEKLYSSKETIVLLTKEEVAVVSHTGEVLHNFTHQFTNARVKTAGDRTLTYDKGGYSYRLDSTSSHLSDGKTEQIILSGAICQNGSYAIVTSEQNYAGSITVFDRSDREIFSWYSASDQIVDVAFSRDGDYLAAACVSFVDGVLQAKLYLLEIYGGEEIEKESRSFDNALPLQVSFLEDGSLHMVCDNLFVNAVGDFSQVDTFSLNGRVVNIHTSSYRTVLILQNAGQAASTLLSVAKDGATLTAVMNGEVFDIADSREKLYLLLKNSIDVYNSELAKADTLVLANDVFDIAAIGENIYTLDPSQLCRLEQPEQ